MGKVTFQDVRERLKMNEDFQNQEWKRLIQEFVSLPYWSRIWIAQEIRKNPGTSIFLGLKCIHLLLLSDMLTTLSKVYDSLEPYPHGSLDESRWGFGMHHLHQLMWVRISKGIYMSFHSLLPDFVRCGCSNKRDRIYALLPLATDGDRIVVDYDIDETTLFQRTMCAYIPHLDIDELLLFGAHLMMALELNEQYSQTLSKDLETCITMNRSSSAVSQPTYSEGVVETLAMNDHRIVRCILIAIFDGPNIHVFEYATAQSSEEAVIEYARSYEYLQGCQQQDSEPFAVEHNLKGAMRFVWSEKPSEEVYYYRLGREPRRLVSWKSPQPVIGAAASPSTANENNMLAHLAPSKRKTFRSSHTDIIQDAEIFSSVVDEVFRDVTEQLIVVNNWTIYGTKTIRSMPPGRGTTIWISYKSQPGEQISFDDIPEELRNSPFKVTCLLRGLSLGLWFYTSPLNSPSPSPSPIQVHETLENEDLEEIEETEESQ